MSGVTLGCGGSSEACVANAERENEGRCEDSKR